MRQFLCNLFFFQDALNCCPDFDTETESMLYAVYDGHGGSISCFSSIFSTVNLLENFYLCSLYLITQQPSRLLKNQNFVVLICPTVQCV